MDLSVNLKFPEIHPKWLTYFFRNQPPRARFENPDNHIHFENFEIDREIPEFNPNMIFKIFLIWKWRILGIHPNFGPFSEQNSQDQIAHRDLFGILAWCHWTIQRRFQVYFFSGLDCGFWANSSAEFPAAFQRNFCDRSDRKRFFYTRRFT